MGVSHYTASKATAALTANVLPLISLLGDIIHLGTPPQILAQNLRKEPMKIIQAVIFTKDCMAS